MTAVIIPDFVFKMFEQKVVEINKIIVQKLCEKYGIDLEDALQYLRSDLNINFNVVHEHIEQIKVTKKHQKKDTIDNNTICEARVLVATDTNVKQCARKKLDGGRFCKLHQRLHEQDNLKYGTIDDAEPDDIVKKVNMKTKRNIY
jgi:hypothetical protein